MAIRGPVEMLVSFTVCYSVCKIALDTLELGEGGVPWKIEEHANMDC